LFNPITLLLAWDTDTSLPVAAVLEVTNTPWKERHRYAVALQPDDRGALTARVTKALHVSPFLDEAFEYVVRVTDDDDHFGLAINVVRPGSDQPVLTTALQVVRTPASRTALARSLATRVVPTQRVSFGIHAQAARLWAKRVPIVVHPRKRKAQL
jgi:DUF1365 family protein